MEHLSTIMTTTKNHMDTQRLLNSTNIQDSTFVDGFEFTNRSMAQHMTILDHTLGNESIRQFATNESLFFVDVP